MRKSTLYIILFSLISIFIFSQVSYAYWIWTPETKKFVNPKYAVKDSPKEQFDWAMSFYNAKDYQRSATEFEKLVKQYEFSEYASKSQYYVGLCYENMQKFYTAYENYQKAVDNFPHISNTEEILAREYNIGDIYLNKPSPKVLKAEIMAPLDRAIEIFKKVVTNAPYGKYAQDAQFKLGEALKKSERYEEAVEAFHKVAEDYPNSKLVSQAMFEEADCAYKASLRPAYDATSTDNAIKTFEKFVDKNKGTDLTKEAGRTMRRLKDNVAEKSFRTAEFYESQGKKEAAIIYYQDVIDTYPDSSFVPAAKIKIEKLNTKEVKKVSAPLDFDKKKQKPSINPKPNPEVTPQANPVTQEAPKKKSWSPLSFLSKQPESEKKPVAQEASKKSSWSPLNFSSKKPHINPTLGSEGVSEAKPSPEITPQANPVTQEAPKKEEPVPQAQTTPKKKSWKPFSFESKKPVSKVQESEKKTETTAQEAPKKKSWSPLSLNLFGSKKETATKETPKGNAWKPLNFSAKKEEAAKVPQAPVVEKPVEEVKKEEPVTPVVAETPKAEPETQTVESPKAEPITQAVETPKTEPAAQTVEVPKKEEPAPQAQTTAKKKSWNPLNFNLFGAKKENTAKETQKSNAWKPLNFGTDRSEETGGWKPLNFDKK